MKQGTRLDNMCFDYKVQGTHPRSLCKKIYMLEDDKTLFEEYFQLEHQIGVNVMVNGPWSEVPDQDTFEQAIPLPFKIASEMKGLDQKMLRPLRTLGDAIEPLADYLNAQSRKIDLMMSYVLRAEDEEQWQFFTKSYGGGGFIFYSDTAFETDTWVTCKLFFEEDAAAVFCYGKLVSSQDVSSEDENKFESTVVFHRIREEDQEVVVRASLHQQSKLLLKKTKANQSS